MAENIKIGIDVDDGGSTKKTIKDVETLRRAYDDVGTAAKNASAVRAAMAPKTTAAVKGASQSASDGVNYGVARAAVGTGAAGRDFGKEAAGLGGLVHVYATFAANLFAVGAAYRALSDAADTANLVKGLDQIGAASGRNLGTLAQKMVQVSDGALSLKESLTSTALASSSGMSNANILRMTEVAKKASLALGRDMPDSMDRLTKGIAKTQPELLDELGIMTKVIPAQEEYGRQIGKTVSQLTEFEKKQAYANAVLTEGEKKFSAIDLAANPYSKLLASLKDFAQSSLSTVNTVLVPIVNLLSQSPTALTIAIGAIVAMLLKQAIPALGKWREGLVSTAAQAGITAKHIQDSFMEFKVSEELGPGFALQKQAESYKKAAAGLLVGNSLFSKSSDIYKQMMSETGTLTEKHMSAIKSKLTNVNTEIAKYTRLRKDANTEDEKTDANKQISKLSVQKSAYEEIAKVTRTSLDLHKQSNIEFDKGEESSGKRAKYLSEEASKGRIAAKAMQDYSSAAVLSNVGKNTQTQGMSSAFKNLMKDVNTSTATVFDETGKVVELGREKLTGFTKATTIASGGVRILASGFMTLVSGLSGALNIIGVLIAVYSIFDSVMSKTTKEAELFSTSLKGVEDAGLNVDRTISALNKKSVFAAATIDGIFAMSNALLELTDSTSSAITAQRKLKTALDESPWDTFKNWVSKSFGGDVDTKLAASLSKSLRSSLDIFKKSGNYEEAAAAFKDVLGVKSLDTKTLDDKFKGNIDAQDAYQKKLDELNKKLGNTSTGLQGFKTSTEAGTKAYQEFIQSTANTNPLFKLGSSLDTIAATMNTVLKGGITDVNAAFNDLTEHPEKFALFGKVFTDQFIGIRKQFTETFIAYEKYKSDTQKLDEEIEAKKSRVAEVELLPQKKGGKNLAFLERAKEDLKLLETQKSAIIAPDLSVFKEARDLFTKGASAAFEEGARLIGVALGQASEKAALTIAQAKLGSLSGEGLAIESGRLKQAELDLQLKAINTNIDLIKSQELLKSSIDNAAAITAASDTKGKTPEQITSLENEKKAAAAYKSQLESGKTKFSTTGNDDVDALLKLKLMPMQRALAQQQASAVLVKGQKTAQTIVTGRETSEGARKDAEKVAQLESDLKQQTITRFTILQGIGNLINEDMLRSNILVENAILENKQAQELIVIKNAIADATKANQTDEVAKLEVIKKLVEKRQIAETDNKGLQDRMKLLDLSYSKEKLARDTEFSAKEQINRSGQQAITNQQQMLGVQASLYKITAEEAEKRRNVLEIQSAQVEFAGLALKLEQDRATKVSEIQSRLDKAKEDPKATEASLAGIQAEMTAATAYYTFEQGALQRNKDSKMDVINVTQSMSEKMKGFSDIVAGAFGNMADAITNFARTGKLDFKGLVDTMLADLLRFEVRAQMSSLYSSMGGLSGILKMAGFGGGGGTTSPYSLSSGGGGTGLKMPGFSADSPISYSLGKSALGNAFSGSLSKFAQGGAFTNSIVNSPTLFKFAKGAGMMGEAGPEAIMPLKRDSNGNLGVRAGGGGTTAVVVNNYGTAPATTKETVDSKGNRKIEVVIGDIVAGELSRAGSPTQQAMGTNFGARPTVLRR